MGDAYSTTGGMCCLYCTVELHSWWRDHFSCLGEVPALPASVPLLSHMIEVSWPGELFIKRHPKIMCGIKHLHWLPEELKWSGFWDGPTDLTEEHHGTRRDIVGDPPSSQPPLYVTEMSPGIWRAAVANGTWLWWPCHPCRELTWLGGKAKVCCWHTAWIGQGKLFHPELQQPAFDEKWVWLFGRTLRMSDY